MKKIDELSIEEVGALFRRKELSPVELIKNIFKRSKELEPVLNSFITILEKEAIVSAKKAESVFLRDEPAHPLCGIPFSVKDLFDTKGVKTTCGSKILKDHIPEKTALLVERLQSYGAILIGKTNMLEFAYGIVHPDYGQTNNPWDITKTAGGSSGGRAASVASGIGLFSLGSDTGGSIRIPASYCGIAGFKPTYGLLSLEGVFPLSASLDHAGSLARTAEDLLVVMETLVADVHTQVKTKNLKEKPVVVGILRSPELDDVKEDVFTVYQETLKQIENIGWEIKEIDLKYFKKTEEIIMNIILPEAALIHEKWLSRKGDYAPLTLRQIEAGLNHRSLDYLKSNQELIKVREDIDQVFYEVDILVMPTVPYPAPQKILP